METGKTPPADTAPAMRGEFTLHGRRFVALAAPSRRPPAAGRSPAEHAADRAALSRTELEVALLAATGASNAAIAAERGVSARTVANQLASAFRKLGVGSRFELAAALARGRDPSPARGD